MVLNEKEAEKEYLKKLKKEPLVVSVSRIQSFRKCHRAHYYKYVLKLSKKVKGSQLIRGSAIHKCLEYYYGGKSWKKALREFKKEFESTYLLEERVMIGDLPAMVKEIMENYVVCWEKEDDELEFLEQELEFNVPLFEDNKYPINFNGFIDFIAVDEKGTLIGETKTHKNFPNYDVRLFNVQSAMYAWVIRTYFKEYKKVNRIMWNYIRAKEPSKPLLLKDGKHLSKKKLDSTPLTVVRAIREYGLNEKDYADLIAAQSYSDYFQRHTMAVTNGLIDEILEDTRSTALQIYNNPFLKDRAINSMNCNYCDFKNICQTQLIDPEADLDFMLRADYEIRKSREEKENGKGKEKQKRNKSKKRR